jgi:ABC-type nitrate/sulfonate/bicarbonate transport system substrate-binding protein
MMSNFTVPRRDFLMIAGAALAGSASPNHLHAENATAELKFGYPNASWGTIGMVGEPKDLFKMAGANVKTFAFDSGKSTRDAMISGRIEIGVIGAHLRARRQAQRRDGAQRRVPAAADLTSRESLARRR